MKNKRCYAKISISNMLYNFDCIKALLPEECEIIPIIKANAYSHGADEFAHALSDRVNIFAVAEMAEALSLRDSGIKNTILILGYTDPSFAPDLADAGLIQTVTSLEYAKELSEKLGGKTLPIHIKLDTGMHRHGFDAECNTTVDEIVEMSRLNGITLDGIFSHFAESDNPNSSYTDLQLERFNKTVGALKARGIEPRMKHIANSAAILTRSDAFFSAVRPGIILYGTYPSADVKKHYLDLYPDKSLKEVLTLCAKVGQVLKVKAGEGVGYGRTHRFERDTVIATITAGYADGIPRSLSNKGRVKINGEAFNIVGNVCMDLLMVDITDAKNPIKAGDEVLFWGQEGISVEEYASLSGSISYELYTGISPRVTRIYE